MEECKDLTEALVARQLVSAFTAESFYNGYPKICDVQHLLSDPILIRAGYMKSYTGDSLKIHTDFNWNEECQTQSIKFDIVFYSRMGYRVAR